MEKAAIYARVSTKEAKEHGRGLEAQIARCEQYAHEWGLIIGKIHQDDVSGVVPLNERPGAPALFELPEGNHLILDALDRLMRPPDDEYFRLSEAISQLQQGGVVIHTVEDGVLGSDMTSHIVVFIKGVVAAEERIKIARRMQGGLRQKAASQWAGTGKGYFGYDAVGSKGERALVINPITSAVVERIFHEYAFTPISIRALCEVLMGEGVPSPSGGGMWWHRTLFKILRSRIYIGEVHYAGVSHTNEALRIIDDHTFDLVQKRLKYNRRQSGRRRLVTYSLASRISCQCGSGMTGISTKAGGNRYRYYRCTRAVMPGGSCRNTTNAKRLEDACWQWLQRILADADAFAASLDDLRDTGQQEKLESRERALQRQISRLKRKLQQLVGNLAEEHNARVAEAMRAEVDKTAGELEAAHKAGQDLAAEMAAGVTQDDIAFYWNLFQQLASVMADADDDKRKEVFFLADLQVTDLGQGEWHVKKM